VKIIIAGSRSITDYNVVKEAVIASGYWREFGKSIEVVCGMALYWRWKDDPTIGGVDRLGYDFATRNSLVIHPFRADWKQYSKKAGHIRNSWMGDFAKAHEGRLLAVWDGVSPGTMGMVDYAKTIGLPHVLFQRVTDTLYRRVE
jgi:hypothetical protein